MKIRVEINEKELRRLVFDYLRDMLGSVALKPEDVQIQVKSKQNYKSEWEEAEFRAVYDKMEVSK